MKSGWSLGSEFPSPGLPSPRGSRAPPPPVPVPADAALLQCPGLSAPRFPTFARAVPLVSPSPSRSEKAMVMVSNSIARANPGSTTYWVRGFGKAMGPL